MEPGYRLKSDHVPQKTTSGCKMLVHVISASQGIKASRSQALEWT